MFNFLLFTVCMSLYLVYWAIRIVTVTASKSAAGSWFGTDVSKHAEIHVDAEQ